LLASAQVVVILAFTRSQILATGADEAAQPAVATTDQPLEEVVVLQVAAGHHPIVDHALLCRGEVRLRHDGRDRDDDPLLTWAAG
jgi:hypothetical protein